MAGQIGGEFKGVRGVIEEGRIVRERRVRGRVDLLKGSKGLTKEGAQRGWDKGRRVKGIHNI